MKYLLVTLLSLTALLLLVPQPKQAEAGYGYGYNNYYQPYYFNYYPTIPTYGYTNYYQPYYQPSYGINYRDGGYHYHQAGYWGGQYWPAGYYSWNGYTWIPQGNTTVIEQAPPNWKNQLLNIAKQREEYKEFSDALKSLGLTQPGIGGVPGYGYTNHNYNLGTYGANGSTVYGYTYSTVKDLYGSTDINALFQQAERLATNAQGLAGQATTDFQAAVTQQGNNVSRVAEILARGEAARQALQAAQGTGVSTSSSITTVGTTPPNPQAGPPNSQQSPPAAGPGQAQGPRISPEFAQLATNKCLKCHGPDKTEGKFDVRDYPSLPLATKEKVWRRLVTENGDKLMPKGGPPLTPAEMQIFFRN